MKIRYAACLFAVLLSGKAMAHPVSFQGAFGIMSYNSQRTNEALLTYSVSPYFAVATTYLREARSEFYIPRANFLLKRWNNADSQGNIYLSGGSGIEKFNSQNSATYLGEVIADWESRRYYVYLEHLYLRRNNVSNTDLPLQDYNNTKLRFGYAPFLADYNDLNVWAIAQFEKHNDDKQIEAMPFLRFFMKNILWEVGAGFDGSFAFNFMLHI